MKNKAIIIAVLVLAGIFLGYSYKSVNEPVSKNIVSQAGWQTYTAPTLGYSFQYPSSWAFSGTDENDLHLSNKALTQSNSSEYGAESGVVAVEIQSVVRPTSVGLVQAFKEYTNYSNDMDGMHTAGPFTEVTINGNSAIKLESPESYFIQKDDTHFLYVIVYGTAEHSLVEQMVSSISFTK